MKRSGFSAMLEGAEERGKSKKAKSKPEHPVIELPGTLSKSLDEFQKQKKIKKQAETDMRVAEAPITEYCQEQVDEKGFKGRYEGTWTVKGRKSSATLICIDKFSVPQNPEELDEVRDRLGDDLFSKCITKQREVVMKPEVMESSKMQRELEKLLRNKFKKFFFVRTTYVAKKGLKEDIYDIAEDEKTLARIRRSIPQAKSALKG